MSTTFYKYTGTGKIADTDYHAVRWEGLTKSGKAIKITLPNAVNLGDVDWSMVEKDDTVAQVVFTAVGANTDEMLSNQNTAEPFEILVEKDTMTASDEIILGAGFLFIDDTKIALTRGGGSFKTNRTYRSINADNDMTDYVKGRIEMTKSNPTLTINALQILSKIDSLYPALEKSEVTFD